MLRVGYKIHLWSELQSIGTTQNKMNMSWNVRKLTEAMYNLLAATPNEDNQNRSYHS